MGTSVPKKSSPLIIPNIRIGRITYLFLVKKLLIDVKKGAVIESGTNVLNENEMLPTAARWHGYTILAGFEPVRKINQTRFTRLKKTRLFFSLSLFKVLKLK